jgi:hypothetical protein
MRIDFETRFGLKPTGGKHPSCKSFPDRFRLGTERHWFRANNCHDELAYQRPEGDNQ